MCELKTSKQEQLIYRLVVRSLPPWGFKVSVYFNLFSISYIKVVYEKIYENIVSYAKFQDNYWIAKEDTVIYPWCNHVFLTIS